MIQERICDGQYEERMRVSLPRGGTKGRNRDSALRKQLELRRNQIHKERARKKSIDRKNWEKENNQKECSENKKMETGMEKALEIVDKKRND